MDLRELGSKLGLDENESVAGFIHIGSVSRRPMERQRVEPGAVVTYWTK